jgi:hypothetical protein
MPVAARGLRRAQRGAARGGGATSVVQVARVLPVHLDLDRQGDLTVLYPTNAAERLVVPSGAARAIPGADPKDHVVVTAPFGTDQVMVLGFEKQPGFFVDLTGAQRFTTDSPPAEDMHVVTNAEFAGMVKPLSAKTDKTVVMLDSCHSGGVANAAARALSSPVAAQRPKFSAEASLQHATLVGKTRLAPAFSDSTVGAPAPTAAPAAEVPPAPIDTLASLNDIYNLRDDRWGVEAKLDKPVLKIGSNLNVSVRSQRDGFVYLFYQGTQPDSFYLLFPNQLDSANAIAANQDLALPRSDWSVTALGPRGTDHLLVMVTETARDFSALALPAEYVSQAGPFQKLGRTPQAVARIGQIATLSASASKPACQSGASRDLGVARRCSNAFGASLIGVEEIE